MYFAIKPDWTFKAEHSRQSVDAWSRGCFRASNIQSNGVKVAVRQLDIGKGKYYSSGQFTGNDSLSDKNATPALVEANFGCKCLNYKN